MFPERISRQGNAMKLHQAIAFELLCFALSAPILIFPAFIAEARADEDLINKDGSM